MLQGTKSVRMERSASTSAEKPRTAWCPVVLKGRTCHEIHILWKDSRNNVKLYKNVRSKETFGRIVRAEIVTEKNKKGETNEYYKLVNEYGDEMWFRLTLMSPALIGSNSFSKMMLQLRCEVGGDKKLASYISRLSRSKDFSHHDSNLVSAVGLSQGVHDDNQEEFRVFLLAAYEDATIITVDKDEAVQEIANKTNRKRKSKENSTPKIKQNKQERIEKFFTKELRDPSGVEKEHIDCFRGRADINIDNLEICDRVQLPIDNLKVQILSRDMLERFDPSEVTLTAVPKDPGNFNENKLEENMFEIVHGRHR
jgi:hypothetical protein